MRKALVVVLLLAGCGSGQVAGESCEEIADEMVVVTNDYIEVANDSLAGMFDGGELPSEPIPEQSEFEAKMDDINERREANCSDEEFQALMKDRADQIEGEGMVGDMFRAIFEQGDLES